MILDEIDSAVKEYKAQKNHKPKYLVLDRFAYAELLEEKEVEIEDIEIYAGMEVLIKPSDEGTVRCL